VQYQLRLFEKINNFTFSTDFLQDCNGQSGKVPVVIKKHPCFARLSAFELDATQVPEVGFAARCPLCSMI
jgi:hypothetical protein